MLETPESAPLPAVYAPVTDLMLYLTEDCNLRCTYCFVNKSPRRMSSETARKAVEFFLDRNISGAEPVINITFFGGEPFLELDRMEEVIALGRQYRPNVYKKLTFSVTTNGTICSDRVERMVRGARMSVLLSLDGGPDASAHRPLRCGGSSWAQVAANLPLLASWSPDLTVRMSFHPGALDLVAGVRHVLGLGAPMVALCPVTDADWRGHEGRLEAAFQELADWYVAEARLDRLPPLTVTNDTLRQWHRVRQGGKRRSRPCRVATSVLGVDPDGHVMPCHRFLYRHGDHLGTVDSSRLSQERWKYVHLSAEDFPGCDGCLASPVCGGGCRAVALQAGLALGQAHPWHCLVTRAHARAAITIHDTLSREENPAFQRLLTSSSALKAVGNARASAPLPQGG